MKISTLQDWVGSWKELKQWCLYKVTATPLGSIVGAIWFRTDLGRAILHDGTKEQPLAHLEDIAELESEKLAASVAATTYAPRETTLSDEAASTTLPSTGLATLVGLLQTVRNGLKYLFANMLDKSTLANNIVLGTTEFYRETVTALKATVFGADVNAVRTPLELKIKTSAVSQFGLGARIRIAAEDANGSYNIAEIEAFRTSLASLSNLVLKINNSGTMASALTCNSNRTVSLGASPGATSDDTSAATTAWVIDRAVPHVMTSAGTLPANAPIGKTVFAEAIGVVNGSFTVTAPSGTVIVAYGTTSNSVPVGTYSGVWFVKTSSSRWATHAN